MKIVMMPKWAMPLGYGLTLWKLVLIREDTSDKPYVIAHEECHVNQWTSIGRFKFPYLYLKELIKVGYKDNKYEVEAREYGIIHREKYSEYLYVQ